VDAQALYELKPDLIVTQDLCHVCAASPDDLATTLAKMADPPRVLCLNPQNLGDVWRDILWVGEETHRAHEAERLLENIGERLGNIESQLVEMDHRPRVAVLEWLDPFYVAGHWVPEMIEFAGGKDVLGHKCTPSFRVTADDVLDADPEILLIAQCGYTATQARNEYLAMSFPEGWNDLSAVRNSQVYAFDATNYLSRPGPRLITGIEALAKILHPHTAVSREAEHAVLSIAPTYSRATTA
jgi:iron complex transport system substrate-binding protein